MIVPAGAAGGVGGGGGGFGSPSHHHMGLEPQPGIVPNAAARAGIPQLGSPDGVIPPPPAGMVYGQPPMASPMMMHQQQHQVPPQGVPPQFLHPQQMHGMPTPGGGGPGSFVHPGATPMGAPPGMIPGMTPGSVHRRATMPTPMRTPSRGGGGAAHGIVPNGVFPNGMPNGMPIHPQQLQQLLQQQQQQQQQQLYPPYGTLPRGGPQSSSRHHRQRRRGGRKHASMDDHDFDPDEPPSDDDDEEGGRGRGIHPRIVPVASTHAQGRNPIPNPPRSIPVPVFPQQQQQLSADGSILVNSPEEKRPPSPVKVPPNPLPVPPKDMKVENNSLSAELAAAADAVKRAREGTELARNKVIARYEADAWRAAGVPIMEDADAAADKDHEKDPQVPLIPGVTGPSVLGSKNRGGTLREKEKERKSRQKEYVLGNVKTRRKSKSRSRSRVRGAKPGDSDYDDEEDDEEYGGRGKDRDSTDGQQQGPVSLAAGFTSLLKRMSTKHKSGAPPPVAPKPAKRGSKQVPPRPPPPAMHNSFDVPEEDGVHPRSVFKRPPNANINDVANPNGPMANGIGPIVNGQQFVYPHTAGQTGMQMPIFDQQTGEFYDPVSGNWWNPNTRKYYRHRAASIGPTGEREGEKGKGPGRGFVSMIKRWTTMTAPDDQPKPITTQLVFPRNPGATAGLKGVKATGNVPPVGGKDGRRSHQQPRVSILPDHPHNLAGSRHTRARTMSTGAGERSRTPWPGAGGSRFTANGNQSAFFTPNGVVPGGAATWGPQSAATGRRGQPASKVYFSRLKDPYGAFRLDSEHFVQWGGIEAPTAVHWLESGKFERVRTGLGALGMETGWTRPSLQPRTKSGGGMKGKLKSLLGGGGSSASLGDGVKRARQEYVSARTEESEAVLRARSPKELHHIVANFTLEGRIRADWNRIWEDKVSSFQSSGGVF
jgi:hypothetical protein